MDLLQTIILGLIQGLTEWLPISSTGHLRIAENLMGLQIPVVFDGLLHVGTIVVTLVFFRKNIKDVLIAVWKRDFKSEDGKLVPLIIIGTLPTVVIGILFGNIIEVIFQGFLPLAGAFAACGIMLYISKIGKETSGSPSFAEALIIGTAQGVAIIPGVSRSGLTIAIALLLGIKREKAFVFSFLLSIPAIFGAVGLTFYTEYDAFVASGISLDLILVGVVISMVVGNFALKLLGKILMHSKFHFFSFYCWIMAIILVGLSFSGI